MKTSTYSENQVDLIVEDLKAGHVVAIATDTVMGLAAVADSLQAYKKLRKLKGHRENKPFPIMVSNLAQVKKLAYLSDRDLLLVNKWFPGKVTFIFKKNEGAKLVGLDKTVAVRIPDDKLLLAVVDKLNKPIFLTSANKSGQPTTSQAKEVLKIFDGQIKSIVMSDALGFKASTIIDASEPQLKLLRAGKISIESVKQSLK